MPVKVGLVSLGCPKNLVDSEIMLGFLKKAGFIITNREEEADVLIVNTCSFINDAKEESIKTILELAGLKVEGRCRALLVAGCLAQRYPDDLAAEMPEIDGLIGTGAVPQVVIAVQKALAGEKVSMVGAPGYLHDAGHPRVLATPPYTAYLKIAEGCDNRCTYCTIPDVRGPFRSRPVEDVLAEAVMLAGRGVRELILVAQDTTRYGVDIYGKPVLARLLRELSGIENLVWLRVMYTYPALITEDLVNVMAAEGKICNYLDIPLQHACDRTLARMNRRGGRADIVNLVHSLRSAIPGITLRTTFIVGFPGETEEEFEELLDFMAEVRFDRVGIFTYSPEECTPAAGMPGQVPEEIKMARRDRAMRLQKDISLAKNRGRIGRQLTVLIEGSSKRHGILYGRGEGDAPEIDGKVIVKADRELKAGEFVRVIVTGASEYDLSGELV